MTPIGQVHSSIREVVDDGWGGLIAQIELDPARFTADSVAGLDQFSHVEVIFVFDRLTIVDEQIGARHPRGRTDWPSVGIFAQRAKARPNRLGATVCRIVSIRGLTIAVEGLDAVDGTPVLDLKPYMREFGPRGDVSQPSWATELMSRYWTQP